MTINSLDVLYDEVPLIERVIASSCWQKDAVWDLLKGFMEAPSPTGSLALSGTILDTLSAAASQANLEVNFTPNFNNTGNPAILLGSKNEPIDLLVDAHLDKPTFGVAEVTHTEQGQRVMLYPYCANRFPPGEYQVKARALRYDEQQQSVIVSGRGILHSWRADGKNDVLSFELTEGELDFTNLVIFDTSAWREGDQIHGPGLDNAAGVTMLVVTASILKGIESLLALQGRNCLFTFSDQEEGPAGSLFGQGASKTAFALQPPRLGSIVVDVHAAGEAYGITLGGGASFGFASGGGRGALLPLNLQRLHLALSDDLNQRKPGSIQHNRGYFSRSDDFTLAHWSKILGLVGVPAADIHTGNEKGNLSDLLGGVLFLSHLIPIVLGLSPTLTKRYQLQI